MLTGQTTFEPVDWINSMLQGIPDLAHRVQGVLIYIAGGRASAANLIGPIAVAVSAFAVWSVSRGTRVLRWYLTGFLAVPMLVMHSVCSYIDLWNGAFLATGFIFLVQLIRWGRTGSAAIAPKAAVTGCLLAFAVSFNSKYQSWPFILLFGIWILVGIALVWKRDAGLARGCLGIVALCTPLFLIHPVKNALVHGNPTHPIYNPIMVPENAENLQNPTILEGVKPQIPMAYWESPGPTRYIYSVFELSRLMPSKFPMNWSIDSGRYPVGNASPHFRMGGWFFATVLVFLLAIGCGFRFRALDLLPICIFGSAAVSAAFMPQSHELRYWLFLPLSAAYLTGEALARLPRRAAIPLQGALVACAGFVLWTVLAPFTIDASPAADYAPEMAKKFWVAREADMDGRTIIVSAHPRTIFWAGPDFNTFKVRDMQRAE